MSKDTHSFNLCSFTVIEQKHMRHKTPVYVPAYMLVHMHECMCTCVHLCLRVCVHVSVCVYVHVCMYMYVCYMCPCVSGEQRVSGVLFFHSLCYYPEADSVLSLELCSKPASSRVN